VFYGGGVLPNRLIDLCPSREQVESQFVDDMFLPLYAETSRIGSHWECRMDPVWCPLEQCNAKQ